MEATLRKEAEEKIALNQQRLKELEASIDKYNQAVSGINLCLQALGLNREMLPLITRPEPSSVGESVQILASLPEQQVGDSNASEAVALGRSTPIDESFPELDSILDDLR